MELISICLSDIPKDKIKAAENGKKYLNLIVSERKEADKFGNTLYVAIGQTKEEREAKADKIYIGNGKKYEFQQSSPMSPESVENLPSFDPSVNDDLPF